MTNPTLVYDDDCGFCTWSAEFIARRSELRLIGFSELTPDQRGRLPENYKECAHLLADDSVYSCGKAMEEAFARSTHTAAEIVPLLRQLSGHGWARNGVYRWIADNRDLFGTVLSSEPPARQSK